MLLKIYLLAVSLTFSSKITPIQKVHSTVSKEKIKPVKKAKLSKIQPNNFNGNFSTTHQGSLILVKLIAKGNNVAGSFDMNGQQAKIVGVVKNLICIGTITETETGKTYAFRAQRNGDDLNFSFSVPEQNNQLVNLNLKKTAEFPIVAANGDKNPLLVGTWRYTEVISSGSGQFYSSFATDYFAKFNADGTALIWTGKSAGGTSGVTIDGAKPESVQNVNWYTEGKLLYLVNPVTKQKSPVNIYIEQNRMMLTSGKNKKVYQRIK